MTPQQLKTSGCKSFICRQEGETEHFTVKNRLAALDRMAREITLWSAIYSTCVVYTKTIIHLHFGK